MSLEVTALLQKVIFSSPDGMFLVAEFIDGKTAKRFRASGKAYTLGKQDSQQRYKLFGDWVQNPKYGETFQVIYAEPERPNTVKGLAPFLMNNVKGVGEATATKLIAQLEVKSIDAFVEICRNEPQRIADFFNTKEGQSKKSKLAKAIVNLITGDEVYRSIMIFLHEHSIPPHFAERIYERYGAAAVEKLTENPYRLISDFRNVGFLRADVIAQKLGVEVTSPFRIEAAYVYALEKALDDGHCCLPRDILVAQARDVLGGKTDERFTFDFVLSELRNTFRNFKETGKEKFVVRTEISPNDYQRELADTATSLRASKGMALFYLPEIYRLENSVAGHCAALVAKEGIGKAELEKKLKEGTVSLHQLAPDIPWNKLSTEQREAVEKSVSNRFMVLTGGPGCGKTFVLKAIYRIQRALGRKVALCAPTGLAAKRMTQSIESQASTLHKLLRLGQRAGASGDADSTPSLGNTEPTAQGGDHSFDSEGSAPLEHYDVVIVDESSMLSLDLFHTLLENLQPHTRLILVGDVDQLPSVGAGNCLRDIIASEAVAVSRLTKIFRQSSESPIPIAAREIIEGRKPNFTSISRTPNFALPEAFAFIPCSSDTFAEVLLSFLKETVPRTYGFSPVKETQILVPMRKGNVGQERINALLQQELNPPSEEKESHTLSNKLILRVGDKVIQTKNNYDKDVFNGDLGFVTSIVHKGKDVEVDVAFADKTVRLENEEADDLQLCYAMTIHKSQGSEFPLCIIPMFSSYYTMLDRNLLYTAVTRGSKYVVIFGEDWAIKKAVNSVNAVNRYTALASLLRVELPSSQNK